MEEGRTGARDVPVDRRASELELQLEQVQLTLQQLRQTHGSLQDMETRLADMTRECSGILDRWAKNDEKHAAAVVELHGRLSEWNDIERRLLNESATRVHQFERSLQHEWSALKAKHEAPLLQLEAQSNRIAETCINAVEQALRGFERAEARILAHRGEPARATWASWPPRCAARWRSCARARPSAAVSPGRSTTSSSSTTSCGPTIRARSRRRRPGRPARSGCRRRPSALLARSAQARRPTWPPRHRDSRPGTDEAAETPVARRRWSTVPAAAIVLLVAAVVGYGVYLGSQLSAGLRTAAERAEAAERDAVASRDQARLEIAAVREAADERLASAQRTASSAQQLATIVAAADLKRFELSGSTPEAPTVQVLWSRSHGIALSGVHLPAPPPGRTYQLWMLTRGEAASVGLVSPNSAGPTSAVFPWPSDLRRAVVGAILTVEPSEGSHTPTRVRLARDQSGRRGPRRAGPRRRVVTGAGVSRVHDRRRPAGEVPEPLPSLPSILPGSASDRSSPTAWAASRRPRGISTRSCRALDRTMEPVSRSRNCSITSPGSWDSRSSAPTTTGAWACGRPRQAPSWS